MTTQPVTSSDTADIGVLRRHAARHELLELLVLRHRAVLAGVAATVLLGLLVTLVAPGVLRASFVTGVVVGLLALVAGVALAFVVHRQDSVLRAPAQARWDRGKVLGWVRDLDVDDVTPVVEVLRDRVRSRGRYRLLLVDDGGGEAAEAGAALGEAAAAAGLRTLLVDLTDARPRPGIAGVGEGEVRLVDAVELAEGRSLATIGAGRRLAAAISATVALVERPKKDLDLLLVVAPSDPVRRAPLVAAVDRTAVAIRAGTRKRQAVSGLMRDVADAELLLVGGHLTADAPTTGGDLRPAPAASVEEVGVTDDPAAGDDGAAPDGAPPTGAVPVARPSGAPPAAPPPATDAPSAPPPSTGPPAAPPPPSLTAAADAGGETPAPDRVVAAAPAVDEVAAQDVGPAAADVTMPLPTDDARASTADDVPGPADAPVGTGEASDAGAARAVGDAPDTVVETGLDGSWQFRPLPGDTSADTGADDPVATSADDVVDDGVEVVDDPDATAEDTGRSDDPSRTIDLADGDDLVATATLEFLASGEWDEQR